MWKQYLKLLLNSSCSTQRLDYNTKSIKIEAKTAKSASKTPVTSIFWWWTHNENPKSTSWPTTETELRWSEKTTGNNEAQLLFLFSCLPDGSGPSRCPEQRGAAQRRCVAYDQLPRMCSRESARWCSRAKNKTAVSFSKRGWGGGRGGFTVWTPLPLAGGGPTLRPPNPTGPAARLPGGPAWVRGVRRQPAEPGAPHHQGLGPAEPKQGLAIRIFCFGWRNTPRHHHANMTTSTVPTWGTDTHREEMF